MFDGNTINLFIAFLAGVVAFLSPCVFPLLPAYLGFFSGAAIANTKNEKSQKRTLLHAILFVVGFLIVFMILGIGASTASKWIIIHRETLMIIGGILLMAFGLMLTELFKGAKLYTQLKIDPSHFMTRYQGLNAFLVGLTFGFAWTPCIGPILASILILASSTNDALYGSILLLAFGLGIGIPFIVFGIFLNQLFTWLKKFEKSLVTIQKISGVLLLLVGFLMVIGLFPEVVGWFLRITNFTPPI